MMKSGAICARQHSSLEQTLLPAAGFREVASGGVSVVTACFQKLVVGGYGVNSWVLGPATVT